MSTVELTTKEEARMNVMDQVVMCEKCDLVNQCLGPVPFHGPTPTRIVVLGEAPGGQEDEQCQPFIGPAGQMIRKHLRRIGVDDKQVTYVNTVSCFPHGTPEQRHIDACSGNRIAQIELADPDFVLVLGKTALSATRPGIELKRLRGRTYKSDGRVHFVTYHPSAALRNGNYEHMMSEDLDFFAELLDQKRTWGTLISDKCVQCGQWPESDHIDTETGLNFCEAHAPEHVKMQLQLFHERIAERLRIAEHPEQQRAFAR